MNPLIFFVIVIVVNMILKSGNNKKNVEQARRRRTGEINPSQPQSKGKSIMQSIREEMEKEAQRASGKVIPKQPSKRMAQQSIYTEDQFITHENSAELKEAEIKKRTQWNHDDVFDRPDTMATANKEKNDISKKRKDAVGKDLVRGIIFSEIISAPKSLKNQRESM